MNNFGKELRELREETGVSLRAFAEKMGVSPTYISKIERGEFNPPAAKVIAKIAIELGKDPDLMALRAGKTPEWILTMLRENPKSCIDALRGIASQGNKQ